jgi:hypothetical protein
LQVFVAPVEVRAADPDQDDLGVPQGLPVAGSDRTSVSSTSLVLPSAARLVTCTGEPVALCTSAA